MRKTGPPGLDEQLEGEEGGCHGAVFRKGKGRVPFLGGISVLPELWGADRPEASWQEEDFLF